MKKRIFHKGFTMIETLTVIAVIAILAALGMLGVDEFATSAKATKIINNLYTLRTAVGQWYADNSDKVVRFDSKGKRVEDNLKNGNQAPGQVKIGNTSHPVQEWKDDEIHFSKYIERVEHGSGIQLANETKTGQNGRSYTSIKPGYYGVCDAGTTMQGKNKVTDRRIWYVGYCFKPGEEAVKKKIEGRMKTVGVWFGTGDAHNVVEGENKKVEGEAVWLQALKIK